MKKRILSLLLALVMVLGMLPIAAFAADVPFSVTADGETAELSYVGDFTDRQYGNRQIPVYLAQVSESAKISVPYESGYRTFGSNYFSEAELVDMTKDTLAPYFTTASNYGLTTENSVAYVELRDSNWNSVYGVLIELIPESDGSDSNGDDTDSGDSGAAASVTVTVDGTALEVTSLGNQSYSDGYAYEPSMVTVPFFTVKVNEGSDFVIDGSALGTVNAFHVSSGASLYGTHPYTMTAATLEAYFLMSAEDFNARFTFEHGLNTENKVAFIEARNSGDRVYCLLVELIPASDDSGSGDTETITAPVSVTADGTAVSVTTQGSFADKQYWGASQIPVYYAKVSEDAAISITYSEDYLALGSDYFSSLEQGALTDVAKADLEAYFVTASEYNLDTANSVAYIEFATNDGYYASAFGLLIELEPASDDSGSDDTETITAPVSVTADGTAVSVTTQGSFADKQYWGASQIPVYYAKVSEDAAISITYSEDYLALGSDYFSSLEQGALTDVAKADLEAYFVTASDYSLDTANSVAYIEFATNDGYYSSAFGLLIELEPAADEPVSTGPVTVTADGTQVSVTEQGSFANKMYYGSSYIPVYYAKVSDTATLDITYDAAYSALDDIYLFSIDPSELMGITGTDLEAYFTTASDYGLDTTNSVAYIEFANGFDPAFGLLIELEHIETAEVYMTLSLSDGNFATGKNGDEIYRLPLTVTDDQTNPDGQITLLEVAAALHEQHHPDGLSAFSSSTSWVSKFWGDPSGNFGYYLNDTYMDGSGTNTGTNGRTFDDKLMATVVEDGDYFNFYIYQSKSWTDKYTYFDPAEVTTTAGTATTLTAYANNWGTTSAPANATIKVTDSDGVEQTELSTTVGEDGVISITFPKEGVYTVELRTNGDNVYVPSRCTVTVTAGSLLGDANDDGIVDNKDLVRMRKYLADPDTTEINLKNADVNLDGEVDNKDLVRMRKYFADGVALG